MFADITFNNKAMKFTKGQFNGLFIQIMLCQTEVNRSWNTTRHNLERQRSQKNHVTSKRATIQNVSFMLEIMDDKCHKIFNVFL